MTTAAKTGTGTGTGRKKGTGTGTGAKKGTGSAKTSKKKTGKRPYTMSQKTLDQRRENALRMLQKNSATTPEEREFNAMVIQHSLQTIEIAKSADLKDPEALFDCFRRYMELCAQNGMRISNIGACSALGISRFSFDTWLNGTAHVNDPRYKKLAEFIHSVCAMSREQLISAGKINPVIGIFWQRNYDGLRNDTEQVQNIREENDSDDMTSNEYIKKYGSLLDE